MTGFLDWLVSLSDIEHYFLVLGMLGLGAMIGFFKFLKVHPIRRSAFFFYNAACMAAISITGVVWLLPMVTGVYEIMLVSFILQAVALMIAGYYFVWAALGRARAAFESDAAALLAFIPLLNLILMFKQARTDALRVQSHTDAMSPARYIGYGLALLVGGNIFSAILTQEMDAIAATPKPQFLPYEQIDTHANTHGIESAISVYGLADVLAWNASVIETPAQINEEITLLSYEVQGEHFRRTYELTFPRDELVENYDDVKTAAICEAESLRAYLSAGAVMEEIVYDNQGELAQFLTMREADCL